MRTSKRASTMARKPLLDIEQSGTPGAAEGGTGEVAVGAEAVAPSQRRRARWLQETSKWHT